MYIAFAHLSAKEIISIHGERDKATLNDRRQHFQAFHIKLGVTKAYIKLRLMSDSLKHFNGDQF